MAQSRKSAHPAELVPGASCPECGDASDVKYRVDQRDKGWYIAIDGCRSCNEEIKGPYAFCPDCGTYLEEAK